MPISSRIRADRLYLLRDGSRVVQVDHLMGNVEPVSCVIGGYNCRFYENHSCRMSHHCLPGSHPPSCISRAYPRDPTISRIFYTYVPVTYSHEHERDVYMTIPDGTRFRASPNWGYEPREAVAATAPKKAGRKWPKFLPD